MTTLYRTRYTEADIDVQATELDDQGEPNVITYNNDGSPRPLLEWTDSYHLGWRLHCGSPNNPDVFEIGDRVDQGLAVQSALHYLNSEAQRQKVRENSLRRAAARQGLRLVKSRRRDPRAFDYGTYMVVDVETNVVMLGEPLFASSYGSADLDDVEIYLSKRGAF